jgi:DNA-binding transcriptional MerR regulator
VSVGAAVEAETGVGSPVEGEGRAAPGVGGKTGVGSPVEGELLRIGEVAERLSVSERTLRYYEELGLVRPAAHSPGGSRRYSATELARVARIRELQALLGANLDEIGAFLAAEDHLEELRAEWRAGDSDKAALLAEALRTVEALRAQVRARVDRLAGFLGELDERAAKYRSLAEELGAPLAEATPQPGALATPAPARG